RPRRPTRLDRRRRHRPRRRTRCRARRRTLRQARPLAGVWPDRYGQRRANRTDSTLFDMASLTKVVATTTAAMILEDEGKLDLDAPVRSYLPELSDTAKSRITVRMILTHSGGFEAFAPLWREHRGRADYLAQINARPLAYAPGDTTIYSDWDFILAGLIIERIT